MSTPQTISLQVHTHTAYSFGFFEWLMPDGVAQSENSDHGELRRSTRLVQGGHVSDTKPEIPPHLYYIGRVSLAC